MVELNCEDVAQWKVFWLEKLDPIFKYFLTHNPLITHAILGARYKPAKVQLKKIIV